MPKYQFRVTLEKMVKYFVLFVLPILVDKFIITFPQLAQVTVSVFLIGLVNYLKVKVGVRIP